MRVPNADRAVANEQKVKDYLLSSNHFVGRYKARFFRSLGYETPDPARRSYEVIFAGDGLPMNALDATRAFLE